MEHSIGFIVLGLVAGVISGCLGVGSGLVLIPAMVLIFAVAQKSAQGISLAVMVPMALIGAWRYIANPEIRVDLRIVALIAAGAVVGALVGSQLAAVLPARTLKKAFAVFLILVAVRILWPTPTPAGADQPAAEDTETGAASSAAGNDGPASSGLG